MIAMLLESAVADQFLSKTVFIFFEDKNGTLIGTRSKSFDMKVYAHIIENICG